MEDDPTAPIDHFRYQWAFLSNFYPCRVFLGLHKYATVEHAYQAAKTLDTGQRDKVRGAASPFLAKRMGGEVPLRPGWDRMKREIMADLLWQKFMHDPDLQAKLLSTGERELIEGHVGDTYWGVDKHGHGANHLGKLLMSIRAIARLVVTPDDGNVDKPGT